MSKLKIICIINCICILYSFKVFSQDNWFKGNTHTHTTMSDGKLPPVEVVNAYKAEGYHFLFITDEDNITSTNAFSDFSFLCINGEEAMIDRHISCLNIEHAVEPTDMFQVFDSTYSQGGFAVINHPMRGTHEVYARHIIDIDSLKFIEIFNGKSEKDGYHDDQYLWDSLLTAGKLIYGIASDDFHEMKHICKGWIMVKADTLQKDSIINAIEKGWFYSSTGVYISNLHVNDSSIKIKTTNAIKIDFIGNGRKYLQTTEGDSAIYIVKGNEGYIRVEATALANKKAWTQPLFWNKSFEGLPPVSVKLSSIYDNTKYAVLNVNPNPVRNNLLVDIIATKPANFDFTILNLTGNIVYKNFQKINNKETIAINVESLKPGLYILNINTLNYSKSIKFSVIS